MALKVGDTAPFRLPAARRAAPKVKLSDYWKEQCCGELPSSDWTPTCAAQVPAFDSDRRNSYPECAVVDISGFIPVRSRGRKEIGMMQTPLCADFYPHGQVSQMFGVFRIRRRFRNLRARRFHCE